MPILLIAASVYGAGVLISKATGKANVGPRMLRGTDTAKAAWEHERWKRALRWPLSFLPSFGK